MKRTLILAAAAAALLVPQSAALAVSHHGKYPRDVHAFATQCAHFQLEGVAVADSAVSSAPWFGLAKSHPNFSELFAILLSAKAARRTITVHTDGTSACGYAAVAAIAFE